MSTVSKGKEPEARVIPDGTLQIYHVEDIRKCFRGCGTPVVEIEAILSGGGMMRITCEAVADIEQEAIRLKVHTNCPKIRGSEAETFEVNDA